MGSKIKKKGRPIRRIDLLAARQMGDFLFALGSEFMSAGNGQTATQCFKYCHELDPTNDPALYNLGTLMRICGNIESSRMMYDLARRAKPDNHTYSSALAESCRKLGRFDEARTILDSVLQKDPGNFNATQAMAVLEYDLGNLDLADSLNEAALTASPADPHLLLNRALIRMTTGEWPEWWPHYEAALSYGQNRRMRDLKMADSWGGAELPGKTLLVVSDQGAGDALQFGRYLPEAKALGKFGKVVYWVQPELVGLMRDQTDTTMCDPMRGRTPVADEVVGFGESQKIEYDAFSSLLGVMRVLKVSKESCRRPPHVFVQDPLDDVWEARVGRTSSNGELKVGLVWSGDPKHGNDANRSIPLGETTSLLSVGGTRFYSFQVGQRSSLQIESAGIGDRLVDLGSEFRDYSDTAAALACMDLLISVDTSVVHLAGCMGKPCWLMVPVNVEWRWGRDGAPWYVGVELHRQGRPREWGPTIAAVRKDLEALVRERSSQ